jgi:hypothetical protein
MWKSSKTNLYERMCKNQLEALQNIVETYAENDRDGRLIKLNNELGEVLKNRIFFVI